MPGELRLEVTEFTDLTRWRWVLKDENGAFLADYEVRLDPDAENFEAFTGLRDYVSWHAAPDKRLAEEARIVTIIGDWIGREVFGPAIGGALMARRPATVQVIIPEGAGDLAYLPLEAARVQGRSLAGHDITLVIRPPAMDDIVRETPGTTDRLRVLGLFSLPEGGTALNLRRERQSLVTLLNRIAASGRAADVRALQYGVTRERLRDILEDGEGWDAIHISGHGVPGQLILETADGRPDRVSADDLAGLLDVARARVKLVTVSACWSAALATAEPRRLLGLPAQQDQEQRHSPTKRIAGPVSLAPPAPGDIATTLARRLGCAVLAMRFPVGDEFAIELSANLYDLLAAQGQPLPRALGLALRNLTERRFPALSMAATAIFGATAAELTLRAPLRTAPVSHATGHPRMAGFPPQPERFVGRTAVMARASAALAPGSGVPGVLLHGMPGGGKTACALELAHTHEDAFDKLIWFKAPDEGMDTTGSLTDFARTLERNLPGLEMIDKVVGEEALTAFLPALTELMERNRFLIVIDNAESLLTDTARWRDELWRMTAGALSGHQGLGRVILTSRRVPELPQGLRAESVEALSADEALLLIRELPRLDSLIRGDLPGIGGPVSRNLALGVLNVAQGHPKLLELADRQAARPEQLTALVQAGGQAWQEQGGLPDGFFASGEASAAPADYLRVLAAWTTAVTGTLSPGERDLFWFLCCLEEPDRERPVINDTWPHLWRDHLGRGGQPADLDRALAALAASGLAAARAREAHGKPGELYDIHPGVAAAGRDHAGTSFRATVDGDLSSYWYGAYQRASGELGDDSVDSERTARAGLAAVPYFLRLEQWNTVGALIQRAFFRDRSRANAAALLPLISRIAEHDSRYQDVLGLILEELDPGTAEKQAHAGMEAAAARGDYRGASSAARQLIYLHHRSGRLREALVLADRKAGFTRRAGLGPWAELGDQTMRLQVLLAMGRAAEVLDEVQRHRRRMDALPVSHGPSEFTDPRNVRESMLDTGSDAAQRLGRWQEALDLNADAIASMRARRAPAAEIARSRFNDYGPLIRLGRVDEALTVLRDCRQAYDDEGDIRGIGMAFTAIAKVEHERGHGDAAIRAVRDGLRYAYRAADVPTIASGYEDLGGYLHIHARKPGTALASHLAAALIRGLAGLGGTGSAQQPALPAAIDLRAFGTAAEAPASVADLCRELAAIPGTSPAALIAKLSPDPRAADRALHDLIAQARALAPRLGPHRQ